MQAPMHQLNILKIYLVCYGTGQIEGIACSERQARCKERDLIVLLPGFFTVMAEYVPRVACVMAAADMHAMMLNGVMRSPMSFHDVTPLGRVLSRFSKDVDVIDNILPQSVVDVLWCAFEVIKQNKTKKRQKSAISYKDAFNMHHFPRLLFLSAFCTYLHAHPPLP